MLTVVLVKVDARIIGSYGFITIGPGRTRLRAAAAVKTVPAVF